MPTYEYACKSCGHHVEVQQSFTDDPLTTCPTCGGPLRKVFGNIAISFKGSGFYSTDNRSTPKGGGGSGKGDGEGHSETPASGAAASSEGTTSPASTADKPKTTTETAKPSEKTPAAAP
ncbi:MAG TPA: FmdB family zinc ribbon protein [Acidimicrobiales bacterium]|nr:FmdB family zinc ribbon protein [Acidimicrobiales bacterium]